MNRMSQHRNRNPYQGLKRNCLAVALLCVMCFECVSCHSYRGVRGKLSSLEENETNVRIYVGQGAEERLRRNRDLQDDKNKDKGGKNDDKNNETAEPTPQPTKEPTMSPTGPPTMEPEQTSPPTKSPTLSPTIFPTIFPIENKQFSVQFSLSRPNGSLTAEQVQQGNDDGLTQSVFNALLFVLCADADIVVVTSQDKNGPDICGTLLRQQDGDRQGKSIVSSQAPYTVRNAESGDVKWTNWDVSFIALQIGDKYLDEIDEVETGGPNQDKAVELLGTSVQAMLNTDIEEESFLANVGGKERVQVSVVGNELETFTTAGADQLDQIEPDFLHTLRIVGVALLIFNVTIFLLLSRLALRRKKRRVKELSVASSSDPQFLKSEEGLHTMLDQARFNGDDASTLVGSDSSPSKENKSVLEIPAATNTSPKGQSTDEEPSPESASLATSMLNTLSWEMPSLLGSFQGDDTGVLTPIDCDGASIPNLLPDWIAPSAPEHAIEEE